MHIVNILVNSYHILVNICFAINSIVHKQINIYSVLVMISKETIWQIIFFKKMYMELTERNKEFFHPIFKIFFQTTFTAYIRQYNKNRIIYEAAMQ